jgi:outer membrane protein assembly factor BamA
LFLETRFHRRLTDGQLFYASVTAFGSDNLDLDNQLLLGGDSGLRGYPLRYQGGQAKALLTLEHRIFTDWYPWRLFNVGAAIFFDAGRTWGDNPVGAANLGLLRDVGVGLRLGSNRLGEGGVLHIDFAFPLDGEETIDNFQILIDARSTF